MRQRSHVVILCVKWRDVRQFASNCIDYTNKLTNHLCLSCIHAELSGTRNVMYSTIFSNIRCIHLCIHQCAFECDVSNMVWKSPFRFHKMDTSFLNGSCHWVVRILWRAISNVWVCVPFRARVAIQTLQMPDVQYCTQSASKINWHSYTHIYAHCSCNEFQMCTCAYEVPTAACIYFLFTSLSHKTFFYILLIFFLTQNMVRVSHHFDFWSVFYIKLSKRSSSFCSMVLFTGFVIQLFQGFEIVTLSHISCCFLFFIEWYILYFVHGL